MFETTQITKQLFDKTYNWKFIIGIGLNWNWSLTQNLNAEETYKHSFVKT